MKRYYKYLTIVALAALVAGCMKILSFNHPDTAPVNTGVDASIQLEVKIDASIDLRKTLVVGMLAPVSWNLAENAVITYSSADMPGGAVTDLPMRVATGEDLDPDKKTWAAAMTEKLGTRGNYEPVEWVAFVSVTEHAWKGGDEFTGTVNVHFTTGTENVKTNLSYFIGNTNDAVNSDPQYYLLKDKLFETTGGSNPTIDYTMPKMCYMTPEAFTWEDIVAINYDATIQVNGVDSPLKDADEVYLMARATYKGETLEKVVDEVGAKTLMTRNGKDRWFLYIYPHEFFGIPAGEKIDKVYFYMVNKDKSIEVKMPDSGDEFSLPENNK